MARATTHHSDTSENASRVIVPTPWRKALKPLAHHLTRHWEEAFFLLLFALLCLQDVNFIDKTKSLNLPSTAAISGYAFLENFIFNYFRYVSIPLIPIPLILLILFGKQSRQTRRYLDALGVYIVTRMVIQLAGLNLLLFDTVTPGYILINQLLLFLPYSLLVWGWLYWRLDEFAGSNGRKFFRLDCERETPRPIDYLVASFSTVFSASISAIKGRSARAKILIIIHGCVVYDLMGLTLSRAVSLAQTR